MNDLPGGTVTFLFTDIEGSTKLWQQFPNAMPAALARHHEILRRAIESHNGYVFQIIGDACCAAFATAFDGLDAALYAQRALHDFEWGETGAIRVRMALHTGAAEVRAGEFTSGEYVSGYTLSSAARLLGAGHGGQILLSEPTAALVREQLPPNTALLDKGAHRLKDLVQPQQIFQILANDLPHDFPALKTLDALPNNLPIQLTSFIGREKEIMDIREYLFPSNSPSPHRRGGTGVRLLTLTGAGGSGKTRLSLQVAADVIDAFDKGAWFVELAPISDSSLVPNALMSALELREEAGRAPLDALTDSLRAKNLLLILDNCEHLVEACARLAHHLLTHCPDLKILASSREGLGVAGEITYPVPPLTLPDPRTLTPDSLSQFDSVKLFIERATAVQSNFQVTNANAPAVAQICYRLDGIPLAIELAAARIKLFSPEQIASRLDDRFRLLTGGNRTAMPRQQTLRAAIDWSFSLLSEQERILFRRLSVFAGGWSFEAAETVCAGETLDTSDVLEVLGHLVDKSLVIADMQGEEKRYRMLETIREFALEKLRGADNVKLVRIHHRDYFLAFAEWVNRQSFPDRITWQRRLEVEHDNLQAALRWTLEQHESEIALAMCNALSVFWNEHGYWTESRIWFEQAIAASRQAQATAPISQAHLAQYGKALDESGTYAIMQGDYVTGSAKLNEALAVESELGDKRGIASVLKSFGLLAWQLDDLKQAQSYYQESLALSRELGDKLNIAHRLSSLALVAKEQGEYSTAHALSQESAAYLRELGDKEGVAFALEQRSWLAMIEGDYASSQQFEEEIFAIHKELDNKYRLAWSLNQKGFLAWHQGNYAVARNSLEQALPIFQKLQASSYNICLCLTGLAIVDVTEAHFIRGTKLLGAIKAESERTGRHNKDIFLIVYNKALEIAEARLDAETFRSAWSEGRTLTMEQAIELAMETANG